MKKLIISMIIIVSTLPFILKDNDYIDITKAIFVTSIGLDYNEETKEYTVYSYVLNKFNLGQSDVSSSNTDTLAYTVKTTSKDFTKAFNSIKDNTNVFIQYDHLKTMILSTNFINKNNNVILYTFIKDSIEIYPSIYLFTTTSKIDDIFNIKNFSDVSAYHTLLVNPDLIENYHLTTYKDFANYMLNDNYTLAIPHIRCIEDVFYQQAEPFYSIKYDGYSFLYQHNVTTLTISDYPSCEWLTDLNGSTISVGNYDLYIKNFNFKIKTKKDKIIIFYKVNSILTLNIYNEVFVELEDKIKEMILLELNTFKNKQDEQNIDIYNLNYLFKKNNDFFKSENIIIDLKFRMN